ncbi:MAG: hypothetical protein WEB00_14830 [Dehalococcoidia bacterium]
MIHKRWFYLFFGLLALASLSLAAACGDDDDDGGEAEETEEAEEEGDDAEAPEGDDDSAGGSVEIDIEALNESGVSGTATLTDNGDGTTNVVLTIEGDDQATPHPAHIHNAGAECLEAADIIADLTPVEGGSSETDVDFALADIQASAHVVIIHESVENIGNYIGCAEIPTA